MLFRSDRLADGEELNPTTATSDGVDDIVFCSFDKDGEEAALRAARRKIAKDSDDIIAYALAYDGFIKANENGESTDALIVEFGEKGMKTAYSAYVSYKKGKDASGFMAAEPLAAGEEPLLLSLHHNE